MHLPEFTYTVICRYSDGDLLTQECPPDRDAAFTCAADLLSAFHTAIIERTERDAQGRCLSIRDVTDELIEERFQGEAPASEDQPNDEELREAWDEDTARITAEDRMLEAAE